MLWTCGSAILGTKTINIYALQKPHNFVQVFTSGTNPSKQVVSCSVLDVSGIFQGSDMSVFLIYFRKFQVCLKKVLRLIQVSLNGFALCFELMEGLFWMNWVKVISLRNNAYSNQPNKLIMAWQGLMEIEEPSLVLSSTLYHHNHVSYIKHRLR